MNSKTLSAEALTVIDGYLYFKLGAAVCSVPYFNNRTVRARAALRARIGKGSAAEISIEAETILVKNHVQIATLADESLKKVLVDNNLGIDCSGLAYYILEAENRSRGYRSMRRQLTPTNRTTLVGRLLFRWRTVQNCEVTTFASDHNSHPIILSSIQPGDLITMTGDAEEPECNHVLIVHQVDFRDATPFEIHYTHAVAYPEDGLYGHGVRQGTIRITDTTRPLADAQWLEDNKENSNLHLHERAQKSKTEIRRLKWWK